MIKLFQQRILDLDSPAITTYIDLIDNKLIDKPIIFSDICNLFFDKHIPIFHTYYIRHPSLYGSYFLTDINGYKYLDNIFASKLEFNLIVLHTLLDKLSLDIRFENSKHIQFFNVQDGEQSIQDYLRGVVNVKI